MSANNAPFAGDEGGNRNNSHLVILRSNDVARSMTAESTVNQICDNNDEKAHMSSSTQTWITDILEQSAICFDNNECMIHSPNQFRRGSIDGCIQPVRWLLLLYKPLI